MTKMFKIFFAVALFCGIHPFTVYSEVVSKVVAVVNGEVVTSQEADQIVRPLYAKYRNAYSGFELEAKIQEARKEAINQLIERKLVLQEAKKKNIKIEDKDIDERFRQIKSKFDSDEEFYYALEKEGMSADQLRENIMEQLLVKTLTRQEITRSVVVRPKEVSEFYEKNKEKFSEPEMVQVGQIWVKEAGNRDTAYKKIKEAQAKLKEGAAFEAIAKEYSDGPYAKDGGDMPFFEKGKMMKEIETEAFAMKVGEVSDIIQSDLGFHILMKRASKESRVKPLSEVWNDIENELYQKQVEEVHHQWIEKLKKKAHIEIY